MNTIAWLSHESPIGPLRLAASARGVRAVYLPEQRHVAEAPHPTWTPASGQDTPQERLLGEARAQLDDYFAGRRTGFALPLDVEGTAFQRAVWLGLCDIAFATTISYGELARRIGQPTAVRAVGLANGRNPVSVIVPCHRVIGADGSMTGYGGGLERKRYLLDLERESVSGATRLV